MNKILVAIVLLYTGLCAGWYDNQSSNNNRTQDKEQPQRGYKQPGDDNYLNQRIDSAIYGKDNAYQGSNAGDDDYNERLQRQLMNKK